MTSLHGLALTGALLLSAPVAADPLADFGTAMKYGLPLAAAACAARDDRLEDFAVRGALNVVLVWGLKSWLDGTRIALRPTGEGKGFPSGHSAAAAFGAADLAGKCFPDDRAAGLGAYSAAGITAFSRVHAGEHTLAQAMAGALIGLSIGAADLGIGTEGASISFGLRF